MTRKLKSCRMAPKKLYHQVTIGRKCLLEVEDAVSVTSMEDFMGRHVPPLCGNPTPEHSFLHGEVCLPGGMDSCACGPCVFACGEQVELEKRRELVLVWALPLKSLEVPPDPPWRPEDGSRGTRRWPGFQYHL